MNVSAKFICIAISILMLAYGWFLAKITEAWSHPAVVYAIFWFVMTILPLLAVVVVPVDPRAMAYILATVLAFSLPAFFMDWKRPRRLALARANSGHGQPFFLQTLSYAILATVLFCIVINLWIQGFTLLEIILHPLKSASDYMALRYLDQLVANPFSRASIILNYILVCVGGLIIGDQNRRFHLLGVLF